MKNKKNNHNKKNRIDNKKNSNNINNNDDINKVIKKRRILYCCLAIFLAALIFHSLPSIQSPYPVGVDSYYFLRIAKLEAASSLNLQWDPLSFGGRPFIYPIGLPLTLGILSSFSNIEMSGPALSLITGALSCMLVFFISLELFKNKKKKLELSFCAGMLYSIIPVVMWKLSAILNSTFESLFLLLTIYFLINFRFRKFFILPALALLFFSPAMALFAIIFCCFYWKDRLMKIELISYALITFMASIKYLGSFSQIYLSKNLPKEIIDSIYPNLSSAQILYRENPIIAGLGIIGIFYFAYLHLKNKRKANPEQLIAASYTIIFSAAFFLGFIEPDRALFYLAVPLCLSAGFLITKINSKKIMYFIFIMTFSASLLLMNAAYGDLMLVSPTEKEADSLLTLKNLSGEGSTILSSPINGHLIAYMTGRKNFIDGNLIHSNISGRFEDARLVYGTNNSELRKLAMEKNKIDYVFFSRWEAETFQAGRANLDTDHNLEILIDKGETVIYKLKVDA